MPDDTPDDGTPDGFDPAAHKDEVEQRWGSDAYQRSDTWWRSMSQRDRQDWMTQAQRLSQDWAAAAEDPAIAPGSDAARQLAARHVEWLRGIPGTPSADPGADHEAYVRALAEMYVADERFAANYGGIEGATFVRDALLDYLG